MNIGDLEPGWHLDGFLYLANTPGGLPELAECPRSWPFLVPHARGRVVIGRNAYGALLLREPDERVYLLDPERLVHRYAGTWPDLDVPEFLERAAYDGWRASHDAMGVRDVLVPVGGELVRTDLVAYYASSGPTRERVWLSSASFAGFPEFGEPEPLGDGRSWTARFQSYNERLDDIYYVVTVDGTSFMAQLYVPTDFRLPVFPELIRRDLRDLAAAGTTNTEYTG
jgi:hypothetical protein